LTNAHEGVLLTEDEVAERLRLTTNRVRWLIMNGHLQRGVAPDGQVGGITEASVEREQAWRSSATSAQRLRRVLSYTFGWLP